MFHKKHWQKKELFHVKHFPKSRVFLRLREDRQSDPESQNRDNAECAPESPAEPAGLVLRMFQLHAEDRARLSPLSGSSGLNLQKPAKIAPFTG